MLAFLPGEFVTECENLNNFYNETVKGKNEKNFTTVFIFPFYAMGFAILYSAMEFNDLPITFSQELIKICSFNISNIKSSKLYFFVNLK